MRSEQAAEIAKEGRKTIRCAYTTLGMVTVALLKYRTFQVVATYATFI